MPSNRPASHPASQPGLPEDLVGPVGVMLAKASEHIPIGGALPGGCLYEPKWDGFRMAIVRSTTSARLWSKQGRDLTSRFPEIQAAAYVQLRPGTVLDGEVVIWNHDHLDFSLLQSRNIAAPARIPGLVAAHPASYVAFDLLADAGFDMRPTRLLDRRARLEALAPRWTPPLQLSPATTDLDEAREWFTDYRPAGVEGLVVKGLSTRYKPGRRDWLKVKNRQTTDVIVGGVLGTLDRPSQLVVGRYRDTTLVVVGRTTPLTSKQAAEIAPLLSPAGPDHPWPDHMGTGRFGGGRLSVPVTCVSPTAVIEVSADTALAAGVFRHPLRYLRPRTDMTPADVETLP